MVTTKEEVLSGYAKDMQDVFDVLNDYTDKESLAILTSMIMILLKSIEIASEDNEFSENYLKYILNEYKNIDSSNWKDIGLKIKEDEMDEN
jgi:hypothetical protein